MLTLRDCSDYVFVPESWKKHKPSPHHYQAYMTFPEVLDIVGKKDFNEEWTGREWYARSVDEIEFGIPLHPQCVGRGNFVDAMNIYLKPRSLFASKVEEIKASKRKQEIYQKVLGWLIDRKTQAFLIAQDGSQRHIFAARWLNEDAANLLDAGIMKREEKPFYFYRKHIETLFSGGIPIIDMTEEESRNKKQSGRKPEYDMAFYTTILAKIDHKEDVINEKWSKESIADKILEMAQEQYPERKHPSVTWLKSNIIKTYLNVHQKISSN